MHLRDVKAGPVRLTGQDEDSKATKDQVLLQDTYLLQNRARDFVKYN